jgi:hypothetical protein
MPAPIVTGECMQFIDDDRASVGEKCNQAIQES